MRAASTRSASTPKTGAGPGSAHGVLLDTGPLVALIPGASDGGGSAAQ